MLGSYFYNERIRKAVAVFGSLFNNIYVVRTNSSGGVLSQARVPLSYAPKRDFVDRIARMEVGEEQERQIAIKLPRMSFEILGINYDPARQLPKLNKRTVPSTTGASSGQVIYTPVPYTINFQLSIYARSQDDALQCVEQILPYFTPMYNLQVKPLDGFDLQEDSPITLQGVVIQDDFEGAIENRRTIIYTLDFEMKLNLYKVVNAATNLITQATINFYDYVNTNDLYTFLNCDANIVEGNTITLNEDDGAVSNTLRIENTLNKLYDSDNSVIGSPFSIASGDSATYGTSTIVANSGLWSYTPNDDFYGDDPFTVSVDVGQNVTEKFVVTPTVTPIDGDVVDDAFTVFSNIGTILNVAANDTWENSVDVTHTIETSSTLGATITINNSLSGLFSYDYNNTGTDTWEYRAIPSTGSADEVGLVTVNIVPQLTYTVSVPNGIEGTTVQATITTNYANNQTVNWSITGDNNTNGRISTTSGTVTMDALSKTVDIVIGEPAGEQGTVTSTFAISDAGTDHDAPYDNPFVSAVTASDTFDILD